MSWRRRIKFGCLGLLAILVVVATVGVPYALARLVTSAGTRPPDRALTTTPSELGADFEDVRFPSRDGFELSGWYLAGRTEVSVVVAHGLFRSRHEVLDRAVFFNKLGAHVVVFDQRKHGNSGGELISLGYHERNDVLGAGDFLKSRVPQGPMFFYGVSMGAAASVMAGREASRDPAESRLAGVIADSCFLSVDSTVTHHVRRIFRLPRFPFASNLLFFLEQRASFDKEDFDLEAAISEYRQVPVLIVAGGADWRMSPGLQRRLFEASDHANSRFEVFDGARHGAAYREDPTRYEQILKAFLSSQSPQISESPEAEGNSPQSR